MDIWIDNGIQIETKDSVLFTFDDGVSSDADYGILSHAHADHIPNRVGNGTYICSDTTHKLCRQRVGNIGVSQHNCVTLLNSGHIPGSTAALIEEDERILYTGDVSVRDRLHLTGFDPVSAKYLIIESTYGDPKYQFEGQDSLEQQIVDWFSTYDLVVCSGYSLGRAQEIELLADRAGRTNVLVNKATKNINNVLNKAYDDVSFSTSLYDGALPNSGVVITSNSRQFESIAKEDGVQSAVFTGWSSDGRYERRDVDDSFVLSDHADFTELLQIVKEVSPEKVYTVHGFKDKLASEIKRRTGIPAISLKANQTRLSNFK